MKGVGICLLRFAIALCYVAFSKGLAPQQQQQHDRGGSTTSEASSEASVVLLSRRTFGIAGAATLSSLLIGEPQQQQYAARADPYNALLPVGSRVLQQRATIIKAEGWEGLPRLLTELGASRIGLSSSSNNDDNVLAGSSRSIGPLQGSPSPFAPKDVYYPGSFAGDWNVTSTLLQKTFPFGPDFVLSKSLKEGSPRNRAERVGDSTSYLARYLPAESGEKAIADRAFNLVSLSRSYKQLSPVIADSIQWDAATNPTRLTYQRESVTADMRPVGPIKAEVYLTARKSEAANSNPNDDEQRVFAASERSRTVTVGTGSVTADDCEIITEFSTVDANTMRAISRVAIYLTPNPNSMEGVLWQQINGKAVAFYDYELLMERKTTD